MQADLTMSLANMVSTYVSTYMDMLMDAFGKQSRNILDISTFFWRHGIHILGSSVLVVTRKWEPS